MYQINLLRADHVFMFAAEELKKYLRMMMPACGEIGIAYTPEAKDGFRLGLLEDFGLPFEGEDPELDDVVHIDTTENGGILAGSNPRSVLFAVYRLLRLNGCRFLFPGTDGEYIPRKTVEGAAYHKLADHRFRGHTMEGDPSVEQVLQYIDYHAKQELNIYALFSIYPYHRRHYLHRHNEANRPPEPVDLRIMDQWKVLFEAEISKRGLQIHDGGHGWVERAAGFDFNERFLYKEGKKECPEEIKPNLAMLGGKRDLNRRDPGFTNICMSRADLRTKLAKIFVEHCARNRQTTYVKLALADGAYNYCECEECRKLRPSDYYVMILNEIDEMLTEQGIPTKIIVVAYVDCMYAPIRERFKNPDRFLLQYSPIARNYAGSITEDSVIPEPNPYSYNQWERPGCAEEAYACFKQWQAVYPGACLGYEYHYWRHQYRDPGMMRISRRIYEDVRATKILKLEGCVEDGSNKSFFPNGFADHIYGATLLDRDLDYEAELEDYFFHVYGKDWKKARGYLEKMSDAFDHAYMCGVKSADPARGPFYNPAHAASLEMVKEIAAEGRELAKAHMEMPTRSQTVTWRLLLRHAEYCQRLSEVMIAKCKGHTKYAKELLRQLLQAFGKYDYELERYFDFGLAADSLMNLIGTMPKIEL